MTKTKYFLYSRIVQHFKGKVKHKSMSGGYSKDILELQKLTYSRIIKQPINSKCPRCSLLGHTIEQSAKKYYFSVFIQAILEKHSLSLIN